MSTVSSPNLRWPIAAVMTQARWGLAILGVLVLPVLIAIWGIPWFVTQDGASHLYNAHLISEILRGHAPARDVYRLNWLPLPNLAGHWLLVALMQIVPPWTADRLLMTLSWLGLAGTVVWLRWRVAGWKDIAFVAPVAIFIASSYLWILGFYNFLLGVCLFPITLGYWWANRQQLQVKKAAILAGLLVAGYLCHVVSAALAVLALVVLTLTTSGPGYLRRCRWTAVSVIPLLPLGFIYHALMQAADEIRPVWKPFPRNLWSPHEWANYLELGNPFSILDVYALPFIDRSSWWFRFLQPSVWAGAGVVLMLVLTLFRASTPTARGAHRAERPWIILALGLFIGWAAAPVDFGIAHGGFLHMRLLLFPLIAVIPALKLDANRWQIQIGAMAIATAVIMQSMVIWDVALASNRSAHVFIEAIPSVGTGKRIGTLRIHMPPRGKVFPLFHMDSLIALGTNGVLWQNYEAAAYFFPVQYRDPHDRVVARDFNDMEITQWRNPDIAGWIDQWARLLATHHHKIDVLVEWGRDPRIDEINRQWYGPEPAFHSGDLRVFHHR